MMDFDALLHGPAYAIYATSATLTLTTGEVIEGLPVIDKSAGVEVHADDGEIGTTTIVPAAYVRMTELAARGLNRNTLRRADLVMNGKSYRVQNSKPRPTAAGEAQGEMVLLLIEV